MNPTQTCISPRLARGFFCITLSCITLSSTTLSASAGTVHTREATALDFDRTFNARGEPRQTHYLATYQLNGKPHQLEVWRDRDLRLKRRTDDDIETYLSKPARETEWQMVMMDLKRRIRTDIDRTNLARIGHFTDWYAQSHSLAHPAGSYQLHKLRSDEVLTGAPQAVAACQWYRLNLDNFVSTICWSASARLPLLIVDGTGQTQWRISAFDHAPIDAAVFQIDDRGFAKNDANQDIQAD